jgi:hypothetical protein
LLGSDRLVAFARNRIHLPDNGAGMRFDHLSTVFKISLVALIVRGIVARRDYDSSGSISMANRQRELRSRSRRFEKENVAAQLGRNLSSQLSKLPGKDSGVMSDRQARPAI